MENSADQDFIQPGLADTTEDISLPSRLECFGGVIVSPVKTFKQLAERPQWLFPLIIFALYVLVSYAAPIVVEILNAGPDMGEPIDGTATGVFEVIMFSVAAFVGVGISVVYVSFMYFAMLGILYGTIRLFGISPPFYALSATLTYAEFTPRLIKASVAKFVPLLTGKGDLLIYELPTGIAPIFSEFEPTIMAQIILDRIELFHLWSFALVAIAVRFVAKVSSERAMLIALVYWIVCILAIASGEYAKALLVLLS